MARTVDLYIDPNCPFAWLTSRWLLNACEVREDYMPNFKVMSLYYLNEGRELDPGYRKVTDAGFPAGRFFYFVHSTVSQSEFSAFYTAWGERFHVQDRKEDPREIAVESLEEAGLDAALIEKWDSHELDEELEAAQRAVEGLVGNDVGTPVISFGSKTAYFGPVLSPAPKGEEAGKLLEALAVMAEIRGFSELKRARTGGIDFS